MWYKIVLIGVNTLCSTVTRLCERGGIEGYKTNHSLQVTAATRLFHKGIDEQLMMERTGHRSVDGVRAYKQTCPEQHDKLSHVLQGLSPSKKCKLDDTQINKDMTAVSKVEGDKENIYQQSDAMPMLPVQSSPKQPTLNFSNCHTISINLELFISFILKNWVTWV